MAAIHRCAQTASAVDLPGLNPLCVGLRYSLTAGCIRLRVNNDTAFLTESSRVIGRKLLVGPLLLLGFCSGIRVPAPRSIGLWSLNMRLRQRAILAASSAPPYFTNSAFTPSGPGALPLLRHPMHVSSSAAVIGRCRGLGFPSNGSIGFSLLRLNCVLKCVLMIFRDSSAFPTIPTTSQELRQWR